jgi:cobalt-precorrin-7 (C5)-methyltransferase
MIYIVGLGPGAASYILPLAIETVKKADMVIGAARHLAAIGEYTENTMDLSIGFSKIGDYLKEHQEENIALVVSGDTGFYSMLAFVKSYVEVDKLSLIPGISSIQYFYSKLCLSYENVKWISLHGREKDLSPYIKNQEELAILTDRQHDNQYIAKILRLHKVSHARLYIGERLSYPDEKISILSLEEGLTYQGDSLSVVVIRYE